MRELATQRPDDRLVPGPAHRGLDEVEGGALGAVMAMQRGAGNRAVARLLSAPPLARQDDDEEMDADYVPDPEDVDEETTDETEDESGQMDVDTGGPPQGSTFEEEREQAREQPRQTSTLTPTPQGAGLQRRTPMVKFKQGRKLLQRRSESGPVTIELEELEIAGQTRLRPVSVSGRVEPTTTTGRGGAPDPLSGFQIYSGKGRRPTASIRTERNMGRPDMERGHVMALELGGPDMPENIVPQWAKFQGVGEWRRMERRVLEMAQEAETHGGWVKYSVTVHYKRAVSDPRNVTLNTATVPTGFTATVETFDSKGAPVKTEQVFGAAQAQDPTDDMLAERQLATIEGEAPAAKPSSRKRKLSTPAKKPAKKPRL